MIRSLREGLIKKKFSCLELTQGYLKKIKSDDTNAFLTVCEKESLAEAAQRDQEGFRADQDALFGIPMGIKDNICTQGVRTSCASKIMGDYKPPYDADVIRRLKASGMVMLGKLNMDEFAMGGSNENSAFGPVSNPVNKAYVAGGSSGGSATAVKAGLAVATLGSDTGGSIRLPASFTGTVGLKPTYGLVSRYGLVAFASSLDQIGPLTNTVDDAAIVLSSIGGRKGKMKDGDLWEQDSTLADHPHVDYSAALLQKKDAKFKIGLPKEYFSDGLQPDVRKAVQTVIDAFKKAGHTFVDLNLPHTKYAVSVYYIVAASEASSNLSRFDGIRFGARQAGDGITGLYKKTRSLFGNEVKRRIVLGTFALSSGYYDAYFRKAGQVRRFIDQDFQDAFKKCDFILGPVCPTTAYKKGEKVNDPLKMYLSDILTIPTNLAGLPGISVPCGRDSQGLPIGVQLIGRKFDEATILAGGKFVEDNVYREEWKPLL